MRKWPARVITLGLLSVLLACGGKQDTVVTAKAPHNDTVCSLDGMVLADYPGPKGQIQYDNGETDYFCDTVELLSLYLQPEQQRRVPPRPPRRRHDHSQPRADAARFRTGAA